MAPQARNSRAGAVSAVDWCLPRSSCGSQKRRHWGRSRLRSTPLALGVLLVLFLVDASFFDGIKTARAAADAAVAGEHTSLRNSGVAHKNSASRVFHSLDELNQHEYGAPYSFHEVGSFKQGEGQDRDGNAGFDSGEAAAEKREVSEALELYYAALATEEAHLRSESAEVAPAFSSRGDDGDVPSSPPQHFHGGAASTAVNISGASMCAADFTCPRSSVAWASGSFTGAGLLTPHSLTLPVALQLKLSLCCQYRFDGTLLRSLELYDAFLQELLQASPFQLLSAAEKRALFPHERLYLIDTWDRRRVYNTSYVLTDEDVAAHNDGDGDVLVLTTGLLTPTALQRVFSSSSFLPSLADRGAASTTASASAATKKDASDEQETLNRASQREGDAATAVTRPLPSSDMQLRITNRVLKCKCPHILTVMPLLHVRRDALPQVTIAGLGAHCGVPTMQKKSKNALTVPRIRRVRRADGGEAFAVSFELQPRLPPTTLVRWTVRQLDEAEGKAPGSAATVEGSEDRKGAAATASTSNSNVLLLLRHMRLLLPVVVNTSGLVQYSTAASPYFMVEPNARYEVSVTVSRGPLTSYATLNGWEENDDRTSARSGAENPAGVDPLPGAITTTTTTTTAAAVVAAVSRDYAHLRVTRRAHGRFILRLPLNRTWALPPVQPTPHFGHRRNLRLTNATLRRVEVAAALNPQWDPSLSTPTSEETSLPPHSNAKGGHGGGSGWLGLGRWTGGGGGSGGGAGATSHRRTLAYYGYWENAPLRDQLVPQEALHIASNPFTDPSPAGVSVPLFLGRNLLAYVVRDVDDVCDPVTLEGREVWAVQSLVQTPGPVTACGEQTDVEALALRELYLRMRSEPKLDVTVPNTTWAVDRTRPAAAAPEGFYRCEVHDGTLETTSQTAAAAAFVCVVVPDTARDGSECFASLQVTQRGVYAVVWTVRVAVRDAQLLAPENIDGLYATVVQMANTSRPTDAVAMVEVRSDPLLIVRRQTSFPAAIKIELPMHARQWVVDAPRALTKPTTSSTVSSQRNAKSAGKAGSARQGHDVLLDNAPAGYWQSRPPIHLLSVDERLTAELDTNDVPNVQRTLPNGTLEFVAQDGGEVLSLSASVNGAVRVFSYTSKCPDTVVEYQLHVVAYPPAPIVPAYAPIYTEEGCVVLIPPRAARKDEVVEWQVPPCAAAAAATPGGRGPYLVERTLSAEEQEELAYVATTVDGGAPWPAHAPPLDTSSTSDGKTATVIRQPVKVLMVCGVEVYQRCDVVWSVHNLVAEVHKTYSLHRCQRPPAVLFHQDGRQLRVSYPSHGIFALPTVMETVYVPTNVTAPAGESAAALTTEGKSAAALSAATVMTRQRRPRLILPIAGYHGVLGYSFNYTGPQEHFAVHLHPLAGAATHQLDVTQHEYVAAEDGAMVLRRRTRSDVQLSQQHPPGHSGTQAAAWETEDVGSEGGNGAFWSEYAAHTSDHIYSTATTTTTSADVEARERQARLRAQQRSGRLDEALEAAYALLHEPVLRRLRAEQVGNASLYPVDYTVRSSTAVRHRSAAAAEDHLEFERRGMCVERPGRFAILAVNPRGSVKEDERYGTVLPPPPAPAVAVLPFCAPHYTFARYPELASVYGYEYTWTCPEAEVMTVRKYNSTYSVLSHTAERGGAVAAAGRSVQAKNGTLCELAVVNHITQTEQRDWFLVLRVYPSPLPATALVVLSDNAASSLQTRSTASGRVPSSTSSSASSLQRQRAAAATAERRGSTTTTTTNTNPTLVTMDQLYTSPAGTYSFTKARRVVGKSVVLHVDAPSEADKAVWTLDSVVPATTTAVGAQVLMAEVELQTLHHHPAALARGRGGSTVLVKGLRTPGLYTITHTLPDPVNPSACPPVTLTEMLDVFHARVLEKELYVCGDTAALQAVPIPHEIAHEFLGQWEVLSLATDEKSVWTAGVNFTGIRFEHGTRAQTLVHGLPFGVVTMRWAIYRVFPLQSSDDNGGFPSGGAQRSTAASRNNQRGPRPRRVLVDYDTVEVFVLTENLPSHRLVTLADRATILTTSSTRNWQIEEDSLGGTTNSVQLSHNTVSNYSHSAISFFAEAVGGGEAGLAILHTYYGLQPRSGSGALTLQRLPVGTFQLRYDLVPSQNVFGKMAGHTCALQGHYEVERVSAYLTATTLLDHECDGYTGRGRITLCLHTEGSSVAGTAKVAAASAAGVATGNKRKVSSSPQTRKSAQANALFWQSQVRLIDPALLEDTVKRGAREAEQLSRGRCATPWWVAPSTVWSNAAYTTAASAASSREAGSVALPGRCVSFTVKAGRHLSPREVAQPLFIAVPRTSAGSAGAVDRGGGGTSGGCPFHGDFISTRVIDGAPLVEGGTAAKFPASAASFGTSSFAGSLFGLSQLFQLGLPHTTGRQDGRGRDDRGWGIRFLPVLHPASLRRANATMRPMVGLRGVLDDVTTELNISGVGSGAVDHAFMRASAGERSDGAAAAAATVLLRLDLTNAKHLGGYTVYDAGHELAGQRTSSASAPASAAAPQPSALPVPHQSLLYKCVEGTVRGSDVLQYWSETNRLDGRVDRTAQEWLAYAYAVRDTPVACDVLFASLEHLVPDTFHPSSSAPQHLSGAPSLARGWRRQRSSRSSATPTSSSSPSSPRYVSLTEMEVQVERLRKQYRWTGDGIDVTGLSADLQSALRHRRVTTTQLKAIEAARRARQAAEAAAEARLGSEKASLQTSPLARLTAALRSYQGLAHGTEVAVLRIQLPLHEAFAVPYDLFLRTALHKDVLCGTSVDPPPPVTSPTAQPTVMNPHSLVPLGRLEIRDTPPALRLYPPVVKQCEVEGGLPVLTFELTGARFARDHFAADEVLLEEVPNPQLARLGAVSATSPAPRHSSSSSAEVGLTVCAREMRRGLNAVVEVGSHKRLYLQLNACPFFKMLTPEEYNEHQDSEELLRRLQYSRYLRVTVRQAIQPDSFLMGRTTTTAAAAHSSGSSLKSHERHFGESETLLQNFSLTAVATPTSTDASFIVEVRPTLARLHLRSSANMSLPPSSSSRARSASSWYGGRGVRRGALEGSTTTENGGSKDGPSAGDNDGRSGGSSSSWWSRAIERSTGSRGERQPGGAGGVAVTERDDITPAFSFAPTPARPLLLCEADLYRYGFQLGIELIGDTWTEPVGEDSDVYNGRRTTLPRQRAPPNVALINSFSVVEHHSLDSSHHLYMKGGGVYRSHFVNYLFSALLSDPAVLRDHAFVRRYNSTFVSITLPPLSAVSSRRVSDIGDAYTDVREEEDADFYAAQQQQQQRQQWLNTARDSRFYPRLASSSSSASVAFPSVRQFCKIEEILFAVPGIATECRGCLLADTTFFVAGDLTGVWSPASSGSTVAAAVSPGASKWTSAAFTRPLVVPWDSLASIPRAWAFEWVCPAAAHRALEHLALQVSGSGDGTSTLSIVMDVVLYRVRGVNGEELPAQQRPTVLLSSQPIALAEVLRQNRVFTRQATTDFRSTAPGSQDVLAAPLRLRVNESAASAAYTQLTEDVLRHRRRAWTTMEYHRDDRDAGGLLVVNASVFLQLCAGRTACTVVSITDALLTVEAPKAALPAASWLRRVLRLKGASTGTVATLDTLSSASVRRSSPIALAVQLHHLFMSYLCHELLPLLGVVTLDGVARRSSSSSSRGSVSSTDSFKEDQQRAHVAYTVMAFIFLFFSYAYAPVIWTTLCLLIWALSLYYSRRPELIFVFVASVLYAHYLM